MNSFVLLLAGIASMIDNVHNDALKEEWIKEPSSGSINLIEEFLRAKNVNYDKSSLDKLRKLHKLRLTIPPVHNGEQEAIVNLKAFGITYPIRDWEEAGRKCLREFVSSIHKLVTNLS